MKKRLIAIVAITIVCAGILLTLFLSYKTRISKTHGFLRIKVATQMQRENAWSLEGTGWKIAGFSNGAVCLNHLKYLNLLVEYDPGKNKPEQAVLHLQSADTAKFSNANIYLLDSVFFLIDGNLRKIYKGT